jgi:ActR/RegA family two-component response regulator
VKRLVLLIDSDLGFVFWLGRVLDRSGYEVFPAKSVSDALKLVGKLHLTVQLLITNASLPGVAPLIQVLRDTEDSLKVILLDESESGSMCMRADAHCRRPAHIDEDAAMGWLRVVQRVVSEGAVVC